MARKSSRDTALPPKEEKDQQHDEAPEEEINPVKEPKTLRLRLLRNSFVRGVFGKKGREYTFPREEAKKRLQKTDGIWEAVGSA